MSESYSNARQSRYAKPIVLIHSFIAGSYIAPFQVGLLRSAPNSSVPNREYQIRTATLNSMRASEGANGGHRA